MATEIITNSDRIDKFFDDLEAQKSILSTCTQQFTTLSSHFSSLQESLSQKSESLDSKFQSLESDSQKTLESLELRESCIPERESSAAALVEEKKEIALAEFEKSVTGNVDVAETLKSLSRKMDSSGLLKFIVLKRKESMSLRAEIWRAIAEAVDPPRLVLDAVEEFVNNKSVKVGVTDKRWACGMLVQALFPEINSGKKAPEFASSILEKATLVVESWKGQLDGNGEEGGAMGPAEAVMFLQMVVGFGLKSRFDEEFLRKLVLEFAGRRDMAKIAAGLGFGEKMADIIDELVKNGKEIEAVYFASESGLNERFPPVSLLKSYLRNSKKNANTILKNGHYGAVATDESNALELNSIRAIIKCVEDHKLETEFPLDSLSKRASQLEKAKEDKRKSSASASRPSNKRARGNSSSRGGKPPPFRPAKSAKFPNAYPSYNRRNPAPPAQHSPAARYSPYNYPSQGIYEGPTTIPYASSYGAPHAQPPAMPQQHYSLPADNMGPPGARAGGTYGGQTGYAAYDYNAAVPPTYQPSSYTQ